MGRDARALPPVGQPRLAPPALPSLLLALSFLHSSAFHTGLYEFSDDERRKRWGRGCPNFLPKWGLPHGLGGKIKKVNVFGCG